MGRRPAQPDEFKSWFSEGDLFRHFVRRVIRQAVCVQQNADPKVMTSARLPDHLTALRYCANCPVQQECLKIVNPVNSYFDGTAGGRLFNNGRDVTKHIIDIRFSKYFVYKHANYTSIRQVRRALTGRISPLDLNHYEQMLYIFLQVVVNGVPSHNMSRQFGISGLAVKYILVTVERDLPESVRERVMNWQAPPSRSLRAPEARAAG